MARSKITDSKGPEIVMTAPHPPDSPPVEAEALPTPPTTPKASKVKDQSNFWERLQKIPRGEWGEAGKTYLYLYISEPFCNIKTEGKPGYLMKYYEPVEQDAIMRRWGSGRYWLVLKRRAPGTLSDAAIDEHTFEIYNPEFPPKIPKAVWKNDARNERWAALLPKEKEPEPPRAAGAMAEVAEVLRAANEIRKDARQEFQSTSGNDEDQSPLNIFSMAQEMLKLQVQNPMVTILMSRMEAMDKANEAARAREFELQKELRTMAQPKSDSGGGFIEQMKALASLKETFKSLFNVKDEAVNAAPTIVKSRMSGMMEFLNDFTPKLLNAPVLVNLTQALLNRTMMNPAQAPPSMTQPQPANGTPAQGLEAFIRDTISPAMLSYLEEDGNGTRFAEWLYAGFPERLKPIQTITHAQMPGLRGKEVILNFYRQPQFWQRIAGPQAVKLQDGKRVPLPPEEIPARETAFNKFVEDFCAYDPDKEDEAEEPTTSGEAENQPEEVDV